MCVISPPSPWSLVAHVSHLLSVSAFGLLPCLYFLFSFVKMCYLGIGGSSGGSGGSSHGTGTTRYLCLRAVASILGALMADHSVYDPSKTLTSSVFLCLPLSLSSFPPACVPLSLSRALPLARASHTLGIYMCIAFSRCVYVYCSLSHCVCVLLMCILVSHSISILLSHTICLVGHSMSIHLSRTIGLAIYLSCACTFSLARWLAHALSRSLSRACALLRSPFPCRPLRMVFLVFITASRVSSPLCRLDASSCLSALLTRLIASLPC